MQITVKIFSHRIFILFSMILAIQFVHMNVIADTSVTVNLIWLVVALCGMSFMSLIAIGIDECTSWPTWNRNLFGILFLCTFIVVMIFSRWPYIQSYLLYGLYVTRLNGEIGQGGIYSVFTVLFYPLCIILAFIDIPRRHYYFYVLLMLAVILVDFVILGTRNAPVFVLLFHLLMCRVRFTSIKSIVFLCAILFLFVFLFDYQSRNRSLDTVTVGWNWAENLRYSWIMEHLSVSENVIRLLDDHAAFLLPVIFLMQYITHSIAAFSSLISHNTFDLIGSPAYLYDQVCIVFKCNREYASAWMHEINPDAGMYQTLYASLLFDLGWIGVFLLIFVLFFYYFSLYKKKQHIPALSIYLLVILATSSIENYIYNGLGLWRFLVFLSLSWLLSLSKVNKFKCI